MLLCDDATDELLQHLVIRLQPQKIAARIAWGMLKPKPVTKNLAAFWTFAFWGVLRGILVVV